MRRFIFVITVATIVIVALPASAQVKLPPITEKTLDNGLEIVVIENHELPVVSMRMVIKSGSAYDIVGKAGLANLTAGLLRKGTKTRTATEIAEQIDFVGGSLRTSANRDATNVTCSVLLKHFDVGMEILSDIILNPVFADEEIERDRFRMISAIKQSKDDPGRLCANGFNKSLFGEHPYGQPVIGTEASLSSLTADDIKSFYNTYYKPNNAIFVVAGDVKPKAVLKTIKKAFGRWEKGTIPELQMPAVKQPEGYSILLVDKPDASQANIRFGHLGMTRSNPDYFPHLLMNYILGAAFTSRLNQVVRVEKGLTYDIRTVNEWNIMPAAYYCNTFTENDSTMIAIRAAITEIKRMQAEEITDIEFNEAVNFYSGYYPMILETPDNVAREIVKVKLYYLPVSYIEDFTKNIKKVTRADILRVARERWHPDNMVFCIVSKASDIEEKLKALGPVKKISIDEL